MWDISIRGGNIERLDFLYYGEEIGMRNLHIKKRDLKDPVGIRYWPIPIGRDMARTPMQWDGTDGAGFTASKTPWLPINPNRSCLNVKMQTKDEDSLLSFYQKLIWMRKETPALAFGDIEILPNTPKGIFAYRRIAGSQSCLIMLNFEKGSKSLSPKLSNDDSGAVFRVLFSTHKNEGENIAFKSPLTIEPYEATILKLEAE